MSPAEIRYVFWDGAINVSVAGAVNAAIECLSYYRGAAVQSPAPNATVQAAPRAIDPSVHAARPVFGAVAAVLEPRTVTGNLVIPAVRVRVLQVDEWFAPTRDLLAIKLEVSSFDAATWLLLRVYQCAAQGQPRKLIYQERFDRNALSTLPVTDVSRTEPANKKQERKDDRERQGAEVARCLTHCEVEVWVSNQAGAFANWNANTVTAPLERTGPVEYCVHNGTGGPDPVNLWSPPNDADWQKPFYAQAWAGWTARIQAGVEEGNPHGRTVTIVGCGLIEDILADKKTGLRIAGKEPNERAENNEGHRFVGDGVTPYPTFRARMRWAMYQICANSKIASALMEAVAEAPVDRQVTIYPTTLLSGFIDGTAIGGLGGGTQDSQAIEALVKAKAEGLRDGTVVDNSGDDPVWFDDQVLPYAVKPHKANAPPAAVKAALQRLLTHHGIVLSPLALSQPNQKIAPWGELAIETLDALIAGTAAGTVDADGLVGHLQNAGGLQFAQLLAAKPAVNVRTPQGTAYQLNFASRRIVYRDIGASGAGGLSHFYFNQYVIENKIEKDAYEVKHHSVDAGRATVVTLDDNLTRTVAYALPSDRGLPAIETPFFLALAHELVHARRIQTGMNAEWDKFAAWDAAENDVTTGSTKVPYNDYHPRSLVRKMQETLNGQGLAPNLVKARIDNVVSRYGGYNREEWDTIEGAGVTVAIPALEYAALKAQNCASIPGATVIAATDIVDDGARTVKVTENLVRKELGLDPRYHYTPCLTCYTGPVPAAVIGPRKFVTTPPEANCFPPGQPTAADVKTELESLIQNEGQLAGRQVAQVVWGTNCFLVTPRLAYLIFRPKMVLQGDDDEFTVNLYGQMLMQRAALPPALSAGGQAALNAHFAALSAAATLPVKRIWVAQLLLTLYREYGAGVDGGVAGGVTAADYAALMAASSVLRAKPEGDAGTPAFATYNFLVVTPAMLPGMVGVPVVPAQIAQYVSRSPLEDPDRHWLHILIHEPMHAASFNGGGFQQWDLVAGGNALPDPQPDADGKFRLRNCFDEGATETFSRIVLYRLNHRWGRLTGEVKLLMGAPYYEFQTQVVCRVIRDLNAAGAPGLRLFLQAYFDGHWQPLNQALAGLAAAKPGGRYAPGFWAELQKMSIQPDSYFDVKSDGYQLVNRLKPALHWLNAMEIRQKLGAGKDYKDPVMYEYTAGEPVWNPIAMLGCAPPGAPKDPNCPICDQQRVPSPDVVYRCPCCKKIVYSRDANYLKP